MTGHTPAAHVRLADLVATLSLGTDLGLGQPMEQVLRECLIALRLCERVGLDESQPAVTYYVALLAWVGCHADAHAGRLRHSASWRPSITSGSTARATPAGFGGAP